MYFVESGQAYYLLGLNFSNSDVEIFFLVSKSLRIILNFFSKLRMYLISLAGFMLAFLNFLVSDKISLTLSK